MALVKFYCYPSGAARTATRSSSRSIPALANRQEVERIKDGDVEARCCSTTRGIAPGWRTRTGGRHAQMSYRRRLVAMDALPASIAGYEVNGGVFRAGQQHALRPCFRQGRARAASQDRLAAEPAPDWPARDDVEVGALMTAGRERVPFAVAYTAAAPSVQCTWIRPPEWAAAACRADEALRRADNCISCSSPATTAGPVHPRSDLRAGQLLRHRSQEREPRSRRSDPAGRGSRARRWHRCA